MNLFPSFMCVECPAISSTLAGTQLYGFLDHELGFISRSQRDVLDRGPETMVAGVQNKNKNKTTAPVSGVYWVAYLHRWCTGWTGNVVRYFRTKEMDTFCRSCVLVLWIITDDPLNDKYQLQSDMTVYLCWIASEIQKISSDSIIMKATSFIEWQFEDNRG